MTRAALALPAMEPVVFEKNFVRRAVCELRHPTTLDFEDRFPRELHASLKKQYPNIERSVLTSVAPFQSPQEEVQYTLQSRDGKWRVAFVASSMSLETNHYTEFSLMHQKLSEFVPLAARVLEFDFFTRIGLRYINALPVVGDLDGWVNPQLGALAACKELGEPDTLVQQVRGTCTAGRYTLQLIRAPKAGESGTTEHILDLDMHAEDVDAPAAVSKIDALHDEGSRLFRWSLGAKALVALGNATPKGPRR